MKRSALSASRPDLERDTEEVETGKTSPESGPAGFAWDDVLAAHLSPAQRTALAAARIGIAGAGGLGSNVAFMLARSGVGRLVVADHDTVCLSNLNRQAFALEHLGRPKALALKEALLKVRPDISVDAHVLRLTRTNINTTFSDCGIVIEAVDDPALKRSLIETLLENGHSVIAASGMAGWGGPPMKRRDMGRLIVAGDLINEISPERPPMAPRVIMAAAMQADAALSLILGKNAETR